jgi:SAM-dependent methyltransferase
MSKLRSLYDAVVERRFRLFVLRQTYVLFGFDPLQIPATALLYTGEGATGYDAKRGGRAVFQWEYDVTARLLADLEPGSSVLDVPFGTGRFAPIYRDLQLEATGVDASDEMLETARATHGDLLDGMRLVPADATRLPFSDDTFDAIVSFRFLPGIISFRAARKALREFARVTRGRALLAFKIHDVPTQPSWREDWACMGHRTVEELERILADAGFRVASIERAPAGTKAVFVCHPDTSSALR